MDNYVSRETNSVIFNAFRQELWASGDTTYGGFAFNV